jgi:Phytanoyl-CoA dioxygenase (PhyH)
MGRLPVPAKNVSVRIPAGEDLTDQQVSEFLRDGFIHLQGVVPPAVVAAGLKVLWGDLDQDPQDPASWTDAVVRLFPSDERPFRAAFENARLHAAFDRLVGAGRWQDRPNLGLFVVRFPSAMDPGDTGWHIDSSYPPDDGPGATGFDFSESRVNVFSPDRALLMLFLYSDVGPDDAPTRIRVGSHLDVPPLLLAAGAKGMKGPDASVLATEASLSRPMALATGRAGDVYLCHPFLVHAAQPLRGRAPRFMAQPPLGGIAPLSIDRTDDVFSPVEMAVRQALNPA